MSICHIDLQKLSILSHLQPFSATFVLCMHRNGFLWTSSVNLDTVVQFANPDFLLECKISAIWRCFPWFLHFICWMSAIFLLPVCLTYWPRKYTTRVDAHVDNSHQVWSWYDHPLPSYSVFVCWYVTWPCDLDLWPFDVEQLTYMVGHLTNLATKFEYSTPIRSWVMGCCITFPVGYHWECERCHCACAESRDQCVRGQKQLHFWYAGPLFAYSLCNFGGSTMKVIKLICENNSRPCVKRRVSFCACAKSRDLLKVP